MEPLFLAVICGCKAGLFCEALHDIYIPRIQRGDASFAGKVLGARGALLSVLVNFFERGRWGSLAGTGAEGQGLAAEDQLFLLMQAGLYLTATRGFAALEVRICYERAESLCKSLSRPLLLYSTLMGQFRHSLATDTLTATMQIAKRVYSLAQEQRGPALIIGADRALAATFYFMGDFELARQHASHGLQLWRSGGVRFPIEEVNSPAVLCLSFEALCEWHFGEIASSQATMAEAISLAKELKDAHALAAALFYAGILWHLEANPAEVECFASDLIELTTPQNFAMWLAGGKVLRGWARCASGNIAEGISWIEDGITDSRTTGLILLMQYSLALKAEALHLAERTSEALQTITEAEALAERSEERWWRAELYRLKGVFLAAIGAAESHTETSFHKAISTARQQKSISLLKRAEATYAEYRRRKAIGSGGRGFRLPLC
jgi:adenylate cyclase